MLFRSKGNKWKFDTDTETDTEETETTETSTTNDEDTEAEKDDADIYGKPEATEVNNGTVGRNGMKNIALRSGSAVRAGHVSGSREREREKEKYKTDRSNGNSASLITPPLSPEVANGLKDRGRGEQRQGNVSKASPRAGSGLRQVRVPCLFLRIFGS